MAYENIKVEKRDHIAIVTIDRPKVLNALNMATMTELRQAFTELRDDLETRVVLLTGAGEKAFVAGADINELAQKTPITGKETSERGQFILSFIERFPKIVSDEDYGFMEPLLQQQEFPLQIVAGERVQRSKRLVHGENFRISSQGSRHSNALPLAARQLVWIPRRDLG